MALSTNDLLSLIVNTIVTNGNNELSAADFRSIQEQLADSAFNKIDDVALNNFTVNNNSGALTTAIAAGSSVNLNSLFLEADETLIGDAPTFKDLSNADQATFTDETGDKFLFPSNLNTFSNSYSNYIARVTIKIDHPAIANNEQTSIRIQIRREADDSVVSSLEWHVTDRSARTDYQFTYNFDTYVGDEADPYAVDGMYFHIENDADSDTSITLKECDIRIFKI